MAFRDGLGERCTIQDSGGDIDHLRLRQELSTVPSFEFALRERVSRLAQFRHPAFARVRSIDRASSTDSALTVVSDHTAGIRLAELLARAEARRVPIDTGTALCLLRQLVPAIAILHETARDVAHGAIAPERLIVTPTARLVVTEYVLGSALEQLLFSRDRYWSDLRIPVPRAAGLARLDHQADVLQVGVVALSLVLGRRLRDDESASRLADVVASAKACNADGAPEPLSDLFRQWLQRALHLDPRAAFPSAVEARLAFERVVEESGYESSPARLDALLKRLRDETPTPAVSAEPARPQRAEIVDFKPVADVRSTLSTPPPQRPVPLVSTGAAVAAVLAPPATVVARPSAPAIVEPKPRQIFTDAEDAVPVPVSSMFGSAPEERAALPASRNRSRSMLMASVLVGVAVVGVVATMAWPRSRAVAPLVAVTGTLAVTTDPSGAQASIDGVAQGVTPLTLTLPAGAHTLVVRGEHGERSVPVSIAGGSQVVQYLDLPKETPVVSPAAEPVVAATPAAVAAPVEAEAPLAGWISVQTRFDVQLFEEGRLLGTTESDRIMVGAGKHELELVSSELGYRAKKTVQVTAGKVSFVSIDAPKGTIALNAIPWAEVTIDGEKAGDTPLGNVSLSIGPHDVVFRHPELGEQRHRVSVTLKAPVRLSADLRLK